MCYSPQLKFKEVHSLRWKSFYMALESVYRCLGPLLTYLAEADMSDPKAQGLKKKVRTMKFVSLTYTLMGIIPIVTKLNLFFQKEFTDVASIKVQIDHTLADLRQLLETDGDCPKLLQEHLTGDMFKGHVITKCPENDIASVKKKLILTLTENIQSSLCAMRPVSLLSKEDIDTYGNDQLDVILNHFGSEKSHTWKEEKQDKSKTSPPFVDADKARTEYKELKSIVEAEMYPRDSMPNLLRFIALFDMVPNLHMLACLALVCPVNTAGCEGGFLFKTNLSPL